MKKGLVKFLAEEKYFFCLLLAAAFFSLYHLTEAPPTWYDEGMVVQLAVNLARFGVFGTQVAPGEFVSGAMTSTGFPVVFPVAASFSLFGINLLSARLVMAGYLALFVVAAYIFTKKVFGKKEALFSAALVITFSSLYGIGKNVLGEMPGLFFLMLFLLSLYRIEAGGGSRKNFFWSGIFFGLCLATKPTFLVLGPALVLAILISRFKFSLKDFAAFVAGAFIPLAVWLFTQFGSGDSAGYIFEFYSNPYRLSGVLHVILQNTTRFFTEATPLHFLVLLAIWLGSIILRFRSRIKISLTEAVAVFFVLGILSAYLRTPGWYRYFFPAHMLVLVFFAPAFFFLARKLNFFNAALVSRAAKGFLALLLLFQSYNLFFTSWIRSYYDSKSTEIAERYFKDQSPEKTFFVYDMPSMVIFLPSANYYQYIAVNAEGYWGIGKDKLGLIKQGIPDEIILSSDFWPDHADMFSGYREKENLGRFVALERTQLRRSATLMSE